jgi:hypothetical protein
VDQLADGEPGEEDATVSVVHRSKSAHREVGEHGFQHVGRQERELE